MNFVIFNLYRRNKLDKKKQNKTKIGNKGIKKNAFNL